MPALSKAESRYLNARFGHEWAIAHDFDTPTKDLPNHVGHADHGKAHFHGGKHETRKRRR